jgi:predicted transposase/invertase (TIGR01784 family)
MGLKPLSAMNDFVFGKIFGENRTVLEDFLKSVLDLPAEEYEDLKVVDPNLDRDFLEDKLGILDVKINTQSGKVFDIEVQVKRQPFIWERMLFYTSKMVTGQVKSGYQYGKINRVISILIADFVIINENKFYHNRFRLYDENTKARFPDSIEINVLELPKKHENDKTPLGNWMRFFRAKTEEDYMTVAQTSPAINEAWGMIKVLSGNERDRVIAELREKAQMDLDSWIGDAEHRGQQEGLQKGKLEVARNLLHEKMPVDGISRVTGLSVEEIERLATDRSQ